MLVLGVFGGLDTYLESNENDGVGIVVVRPSMADVLLTINVSNYPVQMSLPSILDATVALYYTLQMVWVVV